MQPPPSALPCSLSAVSDTTVQRRRVPWHSPGRVSVGAPYLAFAGVGEAGSLWCSAGREQLLLKVGPCCVAPPRPRGFAGGGVAVCRPWRFRVAGGLGSGRERKYRELSIGSSLLPGSRARLLSSPCPTCPVPFTFCSFLCLILWGGQFDLTGGMGTSLSTLWSPVQKEVPVIMVLKHFHCFLAVQL